MQLVIEVGSQKCVEFQQEDLRGSKHLREGTCSEEWSRYSVLKSKSSKKSKKRVRMGDKANWGPGQESFQWQPEYKPYSVENKKTQNFFQQRNHYSLDFFFPGKTFRTNCKGSGQEIGRPIAK